MPGPRPVRWSPWRRLVLGLALAAMVTAPAGSAWAATPPAPVAVDLTLDGQHVGAASIAHPLRLRDAEDVPASITVTNRAARSLVIRSVRVDGRVAGLVFFGYLARVDLRVDPGATVTRPISFDFGGLASQATGLVIGRVRLVAADGTTVSTTAFHGDVRGKLTSVYGWFAVVVALITGLLLVSGILRLVSGTLSANRWSRAVRFGVCGVGVAMTVALAAPAMRWISVGTGPAILACVAGAAAGVVLGYLTPTPGRVRTGEDGDAGLKAAAPA